MFETRLRSCLCTQAQLESVAFRRWCDTLGEPHALIRKLWEHCYIAQALEERGMLAPGRRGLGFGVGKEPLVACFAARGCRILATDMDPDRAAEVGWTRSNEYAGALRGLNERGLCAPELFDERVSFRVVDMNRIPDDLRGYDFAWSSCCFEHLGSIALGLAFIERQMECLRPGGVAVHTTEFNLSSNEETLDDNPACVLFRERDLRELADRLAVQGHRIDLDLSPGDGPADKYVDMPPYYQHPRCYHIRLELDRYVTTSVGLIVEKSRAGRLRMLLRRVLRPAA